MGTASMYGNQVMDVELDCEWMSIYAIIEYFVHGDEENLVEIVSVKSRGVDITSWINSNYIYDLIADEISNADYHWSDHGD
tara:strand:+ start:2642 stop:2884 length:243 start_codon:yes stop_codon:yes gene_type:complete